MSAKIRHAVEADETACLAIMPLLADFDLPPERNPDNLWQGDAKLLQKHLHGKTDNTIVLVAESEGQVIGLAITSMRAELLSGEPSAHLEALLVTAAARGLGVGRALLRESELEARERGALSISLNAFALNTRARGLYESEGFDGELIRYTKPITSV